MSTRPATTSLPPSSIFWCDSLTTRAAPTQAMRPSVPISISSDCGALAPVDSTRPPLRTIGRSKLWGFMRCPYPKWLARILHNFSHDLYTKAEADVAEAQPISPWRGRWLVRRVFDDVLFLRA